MHRADWRKCAIHSCCILDEESGSSPCGGGPLVHRAARGRWQGWLDRLYRKNELASSLSELYRANDTSGAGTTHYDGYDGLNRLAAFHRGVLNADGDGIASGLGRSEAFGLDGGTHPKANGVNARTGYSLGSTTAKRPTGGLTFPSSLLCARRATSCQRMDSPDSLPWHASIRVRRSVP